MDQIDGLLQERCNSGALAMELCLSCNNPTRYALSPTFLMAVPLKWKNKYIIN